MPATQPRSKGRVGRPWRRLREVVRLEEGTVCWLCPHPIDLTLTHPHPRSFSVDHIIPLVLGGDPLARANVRAAHLDCNMKRGTHQARPTTSRDWLTY